MGFFQAIDRNVFERVLYSSPLTCRLHFVGYASSPEVPRDEDVHLAKTAALIAQNWSPEEKNLLAKPTRGPRNRLIPAAYVRAISQLSDV